MDDEVRLRLVSDGTPTGTRLETEDGKIVQDVLSVVLECKGGQPTKMSVELIVRPRPDPNGLADVVAVVEKATLVHQPTGTTGTCACGVWLTGGRHSDYCPIRTHDPD